MKSKILYVVPDISNKNSGPSVRVTNIVESNVFDAIVSGGFLEKITSVMSLHKKSLVYVESSTNRLNIADIISLVFLKYIKRCDIRVYIRDCYTILFPEDYRSLRKKVTKLLLDITNRLYISVATKLYFPTKDMAKEFLDYYNCNSPTSDLPPGIVVDEYDSFDFPISSQRINYILHVGGLGYKYSGVDNLIKFAMSLDSNVRLLLITRDKALIYKHPDFSLVSEKVELLSHDRDGVKERIGRGNVIAAVHTRPLNKYDSMTFPIKILDYVSWKLPIISLRHKPLVSLLGNDYPLFYDELSKFQFKDLDNSRKKVCDIYQAVYLEKNYKKIFSKLVE
ncbi:hypothetical protein WKW42_14970 [Vibrio alginolyticus]|uniref:hypothetical protein n=1 Tax=Vibrio TaxID=662 RepID=UPI00148C02A1|nr:MULTISPECIES: hypothetical protein [Vibrio]MCQ9103293.1 hypothetical protein [Vibrio alginolyticus]MDW2263282.1 hypothetical protein [Vibrio sp. 1557]NOI43114.1 glycosyltransferase family 4 protein [Vibrio alginolyticus]HBC3489957.1 hypothetical protein [Vibrio alginolyticus]